VVQRQVHAFHRLEGAGEDAVVEHHEGVVTDRARVAQRLGEADLAGAVRGEVLHQQRVAPFRHLALDLRTAAEALRLFPHIGHGR
jgi:hypothetical protein